jgi:hypothetical protein
VVNTALISGDHLPPSHRLTGALAGSALLTAVLVVARGDTAVGVSFVAFVALIAVLAWWAGLWVGIGSAALGWLFFSGFLVGRHAHLSWQPSDVARLIVLAGAVVVAAAVRYGLVWWGRRLADPHPGRSARSGQSASSASAVTVRIPRGRPARTHIPHNTSAISTAASYAIGSPPGEVDHQGEGDRHRARQVDHQLAATAGPPGESNGRAPGWTNSPGEAEHGSVR